MRAEVRVTSAGGGFRWQRKRRDEERWTYDFEPSEAQWTALEDIVRRRQGRGRGVGEADLKAMKRAREPRSD